MKKIFLLFAICNFISAQSIKVSDEIINNRWSAYWSMPSYEDIQPISPCFLLFRKQIEYKIEQKEFIIHISAESRYRLLINGKHVCLGPARGDFMHHRFESIDIAPYLKSGKNQLSVMVWNWGANSANGQKTWKELKSPRLIVYGNSTSESSVNTPNGWKYLRINAIEPLATDNSRNVWGFESASIGEKWEGSKFPWGWENIDFNDKSWKSPMYLQRGFTKESTFDTWIDNLLMPRNIPLPEETLMNFTGIVRTEGIVLNDNFIKGKGKLVIPANTKAVILIDQKYLTQGFPELMVNKGINSTVQIVYSESLFGEKNAKGNRNDIKGKIIKGQIDKFLPDGGEKRLFRPTWYRCFRFVQLEVETKEQALEIEQFNFIYTAYPFKEKGYFKADEPSIDTLWRVGWRTARLCAYETYMDCPYFEQLQYVGDTRIQALISLYTSGDDKLMRNAIDQFANSINSDGLTMSAYPSVGNQIIPPFSLFWVLMINDYWMHRPDEDFCKQYIHGIRGVLNWHRKYVKNGMQTAVPFWNFVDWPQEWKWVDSLMVGGIPDWNFKGDDAILSLQYAYTLNKASEMFSKWGYQQEANEYSQLSSLICKTVKEKCWVSEKGMLANNSSKNTFSQHANLWVVLLDMIPEAEQATFIKKIANDDKLVQCTIYYRFYLFQALKKAGLGNEYIENLGLWREMIQAGLTTFAETPEPTRSDCHAWSASPLYDLLATTLGVEPASQGFKSIKIEPRLGKLKKVEGLVPHPKGDIKVKIVQNKSKKWDAEISVPEVESAVLIWKAKTIVLKSGTQKMELE
jgi:hypothetical protein